MVIKKNNLREILLKKIIELIKKKQINHNEVFQHIFSCNFIKH